MTALPLVLAAALAAAPPPIKIGLLGPRSGNNASLGASERDGARLAADEINAQGGVLGRKLELVDRDDQSSPEVGARAAKELLDEEKVVALIGPANTPVANAALQLANERQVPQIVDVATGNKVNELFVTYPENYLFRLSASDQMQAPLLAQQALARGYKRVAVLADDTGYGQGGRARVEATLERRGVKPVYVGAFKPKETDMTRQCQEARAAGADVLLLYALAPELTAVARSLEKVGWRVPIIGSWQLGARLFLDGAGPYGEGALMIQTFTEGSATTPAQRKFLDGYRKTFNVPHLPIAPAVAQAYDAVHLVALAIQQAGTTEGPRFKTALENLKTPYDGATGHYEKPWSPTDHEGIKKASVRWGVVRGGDVVPAQ
ncbi:ABC transporter substrate-binding protein [Anaeromyxobacter paludicola]|uniref:Branched-chain amino acid ABC transporter substrate-binding protein n=1 Tax=Anaeromyxobacter paludicola TaxID=2918171 RepID=A0ABN6N7D4_9BACT|nr:ABC transporter substrate-binding protein [Anaeromyxobacter paludicola]BDG09069.1 branched-chain amino acid ABC transporter substrate-binding protein [Anaeromyxobacter paludicola]